MSLIVTVWTTEGIVMGSDSRVSFSSQLAPSIPLNIQTGHYFDTQEKTFCCPNNCGISTCGAASIKAKNITGYIYQFINEQVSANTTVYDTATNLKNYFMKIDMNAEIHFIVSGYENEGEQQVLKVYHIVTGQQNSCNLISPKDSEAGAFWDGEIDTITRIIKAHYICSDPIETTSLLINMKNIQKKLVLLLFCLRRIHFI